MRQPNFLLAWLYAVIGLCLIPVAAFIAGQQVDTHPYGTTVVLFFLLCVGIAVFLALAAVQWIRYAIWQVQSEILLDLAGTKISNATRDLHRLELDIKTAAAKFVPPEPDAKLPDEEIVDRVADIERRHAARGPDLSTVDQDKLFADAKAEADRMLGRRPRS